MTQDFQERYIEICWQRFAHSPSSLWRSPCATQENMKNQDSAVQHTGSSGIWKWDSQRAITGIREKWGKRYIQKEEMTFHSAARIWGTGPSLHLGANTAVYALTQSLAHITRSPFSPVCPVTTSTSRTKPWHTACSRPAVLTWLMFWVGQGAAEETVISWRRSTQGMKICWSCYENKDFHIISILSW